MTADLLARNVAAHWIQSGLLAAAAIATIWLLTLKEPRFRLVSFQFVLLAIVLLPLMQPWRPQEQMPQLTPGPTTAVRTKFFDAYVFIDQPEPVRWFDPAGGVVMLVLAGIAIRLSWLGYGIFGLMRFSRQAPELPAPTVAGELEAALQVSARYIQQTGSRGPWTFGFLRPTVALPAGFGARAPAFQRAVICHELLHVKRRDMAVAFGEELAVAALWFHPWIWLLRARIRVAREQVVDGRVVTLLANRDEYVRCLVEISGHDLAPHFSQAGAGMLRPRELRARVDAIFQEARMSRMRFAIAAFVFVAITAATGLLAAGAMPLRANVAAPAGQATSNDAPRQQINTTYAEYPQDALQRGIRGTVLIDITVNAAGDVSTAAVVSGPQELRASAFKAALALKFAPTPSTTAMRIPIEYVLSPNFWGVRVGNASANSGTGSLMTQTGSPGPDDSGAIRVGGNIRPPRKIHDAPPEYPALAQAANVQGVVIIDARIDESGNVSHTRPLRSIPLLDQAAMDAVKQWKYEPTLMNGVAVPVVMTVTVNFTLRAQVRLRINMPDGTMVVLRISPDGGIGRTEHPGMSRFGFAPFLSQDLSVDTVRVTIYEFNEPGNAPRTVGNVELKAGGGMVQSTTTPSFGIELVSIERP